MSDISPEHLEATNNPAFIEAARKAKELGDALSSRDDKLELYSLSRQGIFGDNTTPKPGMLDVAGKYKWEAWNKKKGMAKEEAQAQLIAFVAKHAA
jgi:diazepam-binding inhibitor (GABA receptor modulating acyl-CoA-binding protein)